MSPVVSYLWNENWIKQKKIPGVSNGKLYASLVHTLLGYLILILGGGGGDFGPYIVFELFCNIVEN